MTTRKIPVMPPGPCQLTLPFDSKRLAGLSPVDRSKATLLLAQILMQAADLVVEGLGDDER